MAKKPSYLFVSPHLDDAVLSCGGWISYLADKAEVTVASVFTNAHNSPSSLSIRRFLKECGYNDSEKLFADRRMEDKLANNLMGVKTIHLGFLDGLYRLKPQTIPILSDILPDSRFVYPIFSWQLKRGKVSNHDKQLIDEVGRRVKNLIGPRTIIFAPAAVGYHLDHQIVRMACEQKFPETIFTVKEVAEASGVEISFVHNHLKALVKAGRAQCVETRKITKGRGKPTNFYTLL